MARSRAARATLIVLVLLSAGLAAMIFSKYRHDIDAAYQRVSTGSQIAATACGPIEYAVVGEGSPILMAHGAGGGFDQGLEFARELAEGGFRVVAMSRFGYLGTPLPDDASAAAQADAHACLLDALNIPRAAVIGASAGAPSSMQLALRHPDRVSALVLLVPAAFVPRPGGAPSLATPSATQFLFDTALRFDFLFWAAIRLAPETVTRALLATPPKVVENANAQEKARVDQMMSHILPVRPRRLGLQNDATVTSSLPRYDLEDIRAPTLAISLQDDLFGTYDGARYTADHVPGARFIGYRTGGHVWVGHHQELASSIMAFLSEEMGATSDCRMPGFSHALAPGGWSAGLLQRHVEVWRAAEASSTER